MIRLAAATLLAFAVQAAGQEGRVTGTLTASGRNVTLAHVYASAQPGAFDKKTEDIRVLMSDVALDDETRGDVFELIKLSRAGKASIVEVVIDASGSAISGGFFLKELDGMISATGMHAVRLDARTDRRIAGRLSMARPDTFAGVALQYSAMIDAPIPRPPTAEEKRAALASPAALVAQAYADAIKRGDMTSLVKTLAPDAARDFAGASGAERLRALQRDMPADLRVADLVAQTNGSIVVNFEGHDAGIVIAYALTIVQNGGQWKVSK